MLCISTPNVLVRDMINTMVLIEIKNLSVMSSAMWIANLRRDEMWVAHVNQHVQCCQNRRTEACHKSEKKKVRRHNCLFT